VCGIPTDGDIVSQRSSNFDDIPQNDGSWGYSERGESGVTLQDPHNEKLDSTDPEICWD
jgi:hypothetical protein